MATPILPQPEPDTFQPISAQAVFILARLAAKNAVKAQLRSEGRRLSLVFPAEIAAKAVEYLSAHPELYQQAKDRAIKMGYIDPFANITTSEQPTTQPISTTSTLHISGAK